VIERIVKFLTVNHPHVWARQTPRGDGVFGNTRFVFDPDCTQYDYLVVFNELPPEVKEKVDRQRVIFVAAEPANIKRYRRDFLDQFGTVVTNDTAMPHPNCIFSQVGAPWHIGLRTEDPGRAGENLTFEQIERLSRPKSELISLVCSNKAFTPTHRRRLELARALGQHFGKRLDVFGRGVRDLEDKTDALAPYRYHVALENTDARDAWTEKLADPYLAGAFPIYWGCQNAEDYFPSESFARIPLDDYAAAIETIEAVIASDRAEAAREALAEAKRRVLFVHNVFALLDRTLTHLPARMISARARRRRLVPEEVFAARSVKLSKRIRNWLRARLARYPKFFTLLRGGYRWAASPMRTRSERGS